uniref:Pre-rRNA-processing protein Ipi1 N-terminal domain-containing protein n=1 Tax=Lutzomyia longipalpis TaxID=7200 RepID=A0A1B0CSR9_LUTLO
MGKGKHKKVLRSEKAKVKLKGAKLPKGQNITKTDFKVKKILIREQLKEAGDSQVLQKTVGQLCLDIDKEVRRESFRCLQALFGAIDVALVEPFFDMLSSYLRYFSEAKKATFYVEQMVPLLVETWLEIRPQNTGKAQGVLGQEAANTFSLILGIFHELWAMVVRCDEQNQSQEMQNWLRKTHSRDFCQTFMIGFPFSFTDKSHSAQEENLRLCHLFCCLCATPTEQMHEIIDYTSASLTRTHSAQSWGCLLKVLRIIVVQNGKSSPAQARKLCEKLLNLHTKLPPPACQLRGRILLLICHAITTGGVLDKDSLLPWFQRMRHTLCHEEKLPEELVDALGRLYTISREFVLYLGQELPSILINISRMEITESTNALQSKRKLLNFLFWLPGKLLRKNWISWWMRISGSTFRDSIAVRNLRQLFLILFNFIGLNEKFEK